MSAGHKKVSGPIDRDDLEASFRQLQGEASSEVASARSRLVAIATAGAVVVVALAYLAGRRRGRARSAMIEVRRL